MMGVLEIGFPFPTILPATLPASSPAQLLPTLSHTSHLFSRLGNNTFSINQNSTSQCSGVSPYVWKDRYALIAKASSEGSGTDGPVPPSDSDDEDNIPFENIPLESKLQLKLEQKMRMKLAKNIRMRRKKLDRKRRLRKKSQWPQSKLKKNKNVTIVLSFQEGWYRNWTLCIIVSRFSYFAVVPDEAHVPASRSMGCECPTSATEVVASSFVGISCAVVPVVGISCAVVPDEAYVPASRSMGYECPTSATEVVASSFVGIS